MFWAEDLPTLPEGFICDWGKAIKYELVPGTEQPCWLARASIIIVLEFGVISLIISPCGVCHCLNILYL